MYSPLSPEPDSGAFNDYIKLIFGHFIYRIRWEIIPLHQFFIEIYRSVSQEIDSESDRSLIIPS